MTGNTLTEFMEAQPYDYPNLFCRRFEKYGKPFQRSIFQAVLFLSIASRSCFIGNSNIFVDNNTVSITDVAMKIIFGYQYYTSFQI